MFQSLPTILIVIILFVAIIAFYVVGHFVRKRSIQINPDQSDDLNSINGTLLGLLGLLLAFSFSMASSRYDIRRQAVIEEANNISTVILRTDIYPDSVRNVMRHDLQTYVEQRILFYQAGENQKEAGKYYNNADSIGKKVWSAAVTYSKIEPDNSKITEIMIPALNAMMDITTTRKAASDATIPASIEYFLFILCFGSSFLLGYDNKKRIDWVIVTGFAIMLSATVFTILDLDRPRGGFITLDSPNEKIIELRGMFDATKDIQK